VVGSRCGRDSAKSIVHAAQHAEGVCHSCQKVTLSRDTARSAAGSDSVGILGEGSLGVVTRPLPTFVKFLAGLAPVLASPVITYALMGDQSSTKDPNPDYFLRPPTISPSTVTTLALIATVLALVGLGVLVPRWNEGSLHAAWKRVVVCLVICGILVGAFYRVATAAVIGANIGAGVMVLFAGPALLALLAGAFFSARKARQPVATPAAQ
jgi:hypothetical protein